VDILLWLLTKFIIWFVPFFLSVVAVIAFIDWIDSDGRMPKPIDHKKKTQQHRIKPSTGEGSQLMKELEESSKRMQNRVDEHLAKSARPRIYVEPDVDALQEEADVIAETKLKD
jgi:hypothetical protein